ncbi:MAG: DUF262 domain-containing protein [Gammaproteobacteria bacterium]|nr:DUF262 domain-containing protein [Gammaproteobacteria bacterium]
MKIELLEVTVGDLVDGYSDNDKGAVTGYSGKLDIRPPYQREFVYEEKQRNAVIETVDNGYPLNVMYWADRGDGTFEIIDGQQRTISICQYVKGDFAIRIGAIPEVRAFHNLQQDERKRILNYELMVYACTGTDSERLKWFETINIAGEELSKQELRNAVYHGPWVSSAKEYFSRLGCPASGIGNKYLKGKRNRQHYLETAIRWINDGDVAGYMHEHQNDKNAVALWNYFRSVIDWTEATFTKYRKQMQGVEWGPLYNTFKEADLDPVTLEADTERLMRDEEVQRKSGIYSYLLDGEERNLNLRTFNEPMKTEAFERQDGVCPRCNETFSFSEMEGDHIDPWAEGGRTVAENCQMLCKSCNRRKGNK